MSLWKAPNSWLCFSPCQAIPRGWWGLEAICWKSHCIPTAWDSELSSSGSLLVQLLPECQKKKRRLETFYDLLTHESGRKLTVNLEKQWRGLEICCCCSLQGCFFLQVAMGASGLLQFTSVCSSWLTWIYFVV